MALRVRGTFKKRDAQLAMTNTRRTRKRPGRQRHAFLRIRFANNDVRIAYRDGFENTIQMTIQNASQTMPSPDFRILVTLNRAFPFRHSTGHWPTVTKQNRNFENGLASVRAPVFPADRLSLPPALVRANNH